MTLHGTAVLADTTVIEILGRHASLVRGRDPIYSSSRLVVPFGTLDRLDLSAHPVYPDATIVTIGAGKWALDIAVPNGSDAEQLLREAAPSGRV